MLRGTTIMKQIILTILLFVLTVTPALAVSDAHLKVVVKLDDSSYVEGATVELRETALDCSTDEAFFAEDDTDALGSTPIYGVDPSKCYVAKVTDSPDGLTCKGRNGDLDHGLFGVLIPSLEENVLYMECHVPYVPEMSVIGAAFALGVSGFYIRRRRD